MTFGTDAPRTSVGRRPFATASPPCRPWPLTACCWTAADEGKLMRPRWGLQALARLEGGSLDGGRADEDGGGTALWGIAPAKPEGHRWVTTHAARSLPRWSGAGEIQAPGGLGALSGDSLRALHPRLCTDDA